MHWPQVERSASGATEPRRIGEDRCNPGSAAVAGAVDARVARIGGAEEPALRVNEREEMALSALQPRERDLRPRGSGVSRVPELQVLTLQGALRRVGNEPSLTVADERGIWIR